MTAKEEETIELVPITNLPGSVELLKKAWLIYKQNFFTFFGIALIFTVVNQLLFNYSDTPFLGPLISILTFIITALGIASLIYAIKDKDESIDILEAYRRGWRKLRSFLWITILFIAALLLGLILLIIPGIVFYVWFSFATYVLITEDLKGFKALNKSREYTRGRWWAVFGRLLFIFLISLSYFVFYFGVSSIVPLQINLVINPLIRSLLIPLGVIYTYFLYVHLKSLKNSVQSN